ncbi:hypothetical protein [Dactylosporangium sp. CS-033363]|uniref:hypothetical protein n=1 Tax=Dactylosporangium sp. CS-033363 TaxID=3239935 RepID=UPI003D93838B
MEPWQFPREVTIAGTWSVQYGNYAMVEFRSTGAGFSIVAYSNVVIGTTRFELPSGTVLGDVRGAGGSAYEGRHAMYQLANGQFARWSTMRLNRESNWRLVGSIFDIHGVLPITFHRAG